VFGIPDEEYGEALAAAIILDPGAGLTPEAIRVYLSQHIANYTVPRCISIVSSLPRDDNGKVAKRRLRDACWSGQSRRI
jgi:long-chain acyl-CoA synthetase